MTNEQTTTTTAGPLDVVLATLDELLQQHDDDDAAPTMLSDARDALAAIAARNVLVIDDDADLHLLWLGTETLVEANADDPAAKRLDDLVGAAVQHAQNRRERQRPHARRMILPEGEMCARCGEQMRHGSFVLDVITDAASMPYATSEWATIHVDCVTDDDRHVSDTAS